MGMPINSFQIFYHLGNRSDSYEAREARRAVEGFHLFALILHDPNQHASLDRVIQTRFSQYDRLSGEKLLFFALTSQQASLPTNLQQREYYQAVNRLDDPLFRSLSNLASKASPDTAFTAAINLGIPHEDLPCIVVTPDLRLKNIIWYKTCAEHLQDQLFHLSRLAESEPFVRKNILEKNDLFQNMLEPQSHKLNLCGGWEKASLPQQLTEILADVLSTMSDFDIFDHWTNQQAKAHWRACIDRTYLKMNELKSRHQAEFPEFEQISLKLATLIANACKQRPDHRFISLPVNRLDTYSQRLLTTANKLEWMLHDESFEQLDYSPLAICLAKIFEMELNLSVVHWIRQELQIELPEFFMKIQPHKSAVLEFEKNGQVNHIDFNAGQKGQWIPPGMGQSEMSFEYLVQNGHQIPNALTRNQSLFLSTWSQIRRLRNQCSHPKPFTQDKVEQLKRSLDKLNQHHCFDVFYQLKQQYSGLGNENQVIVNGPENTERSNLSEQEKLKLYRNIYRVLVKSAEATASEIAGFRLLLMDAYGAERTRELIGLWNDQLKNEPVTRHSDRDIHFERLAMDL